jgi:glutathione S-transferase
MQKEMTMITLYDFPLSGHAHRVRLMLSLLNLDYELVQVDLTRGEQKTPDFLQLNPFGVVPVLVDGDLVLRESTAILTYLARIYGPQWLPIEPVAMAEVQTWLATANKDVVTGPGAARLVTVFNAPLDHAALISKSHELLTTIDKHLVDRQWLALEHPTIADVAAYSYIAHAPEGHVSLDGYPNIRRWITSIEALPGFVGMPRTEVPAAA